METADDNNPKLGSDSQDSDELQPAGTSGYDRSVPIKLVTVDSKPDKKMPLSNKGVENAKKRLRAFSIQKKSSLSPVSVPKPVSSGGATVYIGKLASAKTQPKPEQDLVAEQKKLPKPPKPGAKQWQESYMLTQKKTLAEIEDMKRKMELVELGIPLGLICPAPNSDKAMPTKAMPPIKSFIAPAKVDELIREAKKARAEGREFKFDYHKLLPDYDNPFQRKKDEAESKSDDHDQKKWEKDKKRMEKFELRRHPTYKTSDKDRGDRHRDDKYRDKPRERDEKYKDSDRSKNRDGKSRDRDAAHKERNYKSKDTDPKSKERETKSKDKDRKSKERDDKSKERDNKSKERDTKSKDRDAKSKERDKSKEIYPKKEDLQKDEKEADVNLKDFVVCDSWSDNEEKSIDSTPKREERNKTTKERTTLLGVKNDPMELLRESLLCKDKASKSPTPKMKRLNPVIDSFKFEIDEPKEDDILDIFDENSAIEKFAEIKPKKDNLYDSPLSMKLFDYDLKDETMDGLADDTFLESVINEIKQEDMDETSQDKGLVEYDESPTKEDEMRDSVTPDLDDRTRELHSSRSEYSDSYKSIESGKSVESGYKSNDSLKVSESFKSDSEVMEKDVEATQMPKYTVDSLETWSFVLKICQPLLFRHDKNKCYKETRITPKVWFTENPKVCNCVKDRRVVYKELETCKMELVHSLLAAKQVQEAAYPTARGWYPRSEHCLAESSTVQLSSEWEAEDSQSEQPPSTPKRGTVSLDTEYQRFMEAVWPEVADAKSETPRSTPVRREAKKKNDDDHDTRKVKKMKLSDGFSQESEKDDEVSEKSVGKKLKTEKQKRKRKHSTSTSVTDSSESDAKKRKKMHKKKDYKKSKSKEAKRRRLLKKNIKRLKDKAQKKKKKIIQLDEESDLQDTEKEKKKKEKKIKKKKQLNKKKKTQKKKKSRAKSSSSSSSSSDKSSDSESEPEKKSKKKKKNSEKKKRNMSSSDTIQEESTIFDVNILNNIKTEKITDDEKTKQLEFSPRRQKPREIINVKELQNDFVGNSIQIKKEVEFEDSRIVEEEKTHVAEEKQVIEEHMPAAEEQNVESKEAGSAEKQEEESQESQSQNAVEEKDQQNVFKEQDESQSTPQLEQRPDESNLSQCSSQESIYSLKDAPLYEKDESHLRPSSQNSNYSFHDVMASGMYSKAMDEHDMLRHAHDVPRHAHDMQPHADHDMDNQETYEQGNYEMYEQMAMAYQSDVASQRTSPPDASGSRRIETVVRARACGEIKCDWRADDPAAPPPAPAHPRAARPSRWGLKPGDVNIVLTGGTEQFPIRSVLEPVYKIQSLANRTDNSATGYDEAYMDMYGAADKLQYGDCFSTGGAGGTGGEGAGEGRRAILTHTSSLDHRIDLALRTTVLGEVAKTDEAGDKDAPEKGILVTKSLSVPESRGAKRVSFADGYTPGQDSDVEEPPVKKRKKGRRLGCAWPCAASHADHVPLWDALPPPPPPPGSPPPPARAAPPAHLLRRPPPPPALLPPHHHAAHKFDPNSMTAFMPPEPPPGLISFQNL